MFVPGQPKVSKCSGIDSSTITFLGLLMVLLLPLLLEPLRFVLFEPEASVIRDDDEVVAVLDLGIVAIVIG